MSFVPPLQDPNSPNIDEWFCSTAFRTALVQNAQIHQALYGQSVIDRNYKASEWLTAGVFGAVGALAYIHVFPLGSAIPGFVLGVLGSFIIQAAERFVKKEMTRNVSEQEHAHLLEAMSVFLQKNYTPTQRGELYYSLIGPYHKSMKTQITLEFEYLGEFAKALSRIDPEHTNFHPETLRHHKKTIAMHRFGQLAYSYAKKITLSPLFGLKLKPLILHKGGSTELVEQSATHTAAKEANTRTLDRNSPIDPQIIKKHFDGFVELLKEKNPALGARFEESVLSKVVDTSTKIPPQNSGQSATSQPDTNPPPTKRIRL